MQISSSMRVSSGSSTMRGRSNNVAHNGFISFLMLMISFVACFYIAGRLWQDAEKRVTMMNMLDKSKGMGNKPVTVEDKLQILGCKDAERRLAELEVELASAKSQGFTRKWISLSNGNNTSRSPLLAVIGINTEFANRRKRDVIRNKWLPTGESLKKLEKEKGIVVRFVVGRSANKGDSSDRRIDLENQETKDFLILEEHVEVPEELATKAKNFFSVAVETWDADFYMKVDDDVLVNIDELKKLLTSYVDRPRVYAGCMKSGDVIIEAGQRWYEKEWWKFGDGKSYFRHTSGQLYILSKALAQYIYINRDFLHTYAHEDVSVGSWMLGLDVEHVDERRACCTSSSQGAVCSKF